ncbi:hypothetical protein HanXRQr2_Chr07g0299511 [Helianthus annuus]|uniref:Uncharacterized protein n=1 Tax=Helianthus annuus TaxID=4232 RepID=A0A9K3NG39_HELAN|nr:hypothetical protein HanXRQr2_Chr07g0299511 [Helianthus annuus]KAJ0905089.1 hypothetical protein HanPSC8_Chr07g0289991 [Helianthus annuus]
MVQETQHNTYLFRVGIRRCNIPVPLAINRRVSTPANRIHLPLRKIIIHHMKIPKSTPRHSLYQPSPKMIKRNRNLQ